MSWETFLDTLGDSEQRNQVIGEAVALIRTLAQPDVGLGRQLGIFPSDPGDPAHIHFLHAMPVLQLPANFNLASEEGLMATFDRFNRVIILIGGEHGYLTSLTVRQSSAQGPWKVIRVGRSHIVKALNKFNTMMTDEVTLSVGGRDIETQRHLTQLPLVMLRMPDVRQYLMVMEVVGAPRRDVPFLFFPIYEDPRLGFHEGQALTLGDVQRAIDRST